MSVRGPWYKLEGLGPFPSHAMLLTLPSGSVHDIVHLHRSFRAERHCEATGGRVWGGTTYI